MPLDCTSGSVIHIKDFKSENFDPADKFVFIVGQLDRNTAVAFLITTQAWNGTMRPGEIVQLEQAAKGFPRKKCYIQCFDLHRLDINDLQADFVNRNIQNCGNLGKGVLQKVLDVVADSDLLPQNDIQLVFEVLKDL